MPDDGEPEWLFHEDKSLEEQTVFSVETDNYTIYISKTDNVVYDDFELKPIEKEIIINVRIHKSLEPDLFFTLNPDKLSGDTSYTSSKLAEDSKGCSVFPKPDHQESICDLCGTNIVKGARFMSFTGGTASSEVHCSCWSELIHFIEASMMDKSEETVSHML